MLLSSPACRCLTYIVRVSMCLAAALVARPGILGAAQFNGPRDYEVKAVYLFNFGRFTTWSPATAASDVFTICILGRDPFGPALDATLADEQIAGQTLLIRRLARPQESAGCRILFISESEEHQLAQLFEQLDGTGILTVSDMPRFVARGGMIQFVAQGSKIRFQINLTATERAGLMLSSELLRVAATVTRAEPTP